MLAGRFTKENSPLAIPFHAAWFGCAYYSIWVKGAPPLLRITWLVPVPEPPLSLVPEPLPSPRLSLCPGLVLSYGPCACALCRLPAWRTAGILGISLRARGHAAGWPASEQSLYFRPFLPLKLVPSPLLVHYAPTLVLNIFFFLFFFLSFLGYIGLILRLGNRP